MQRNEGVDPFKVYFEQDERPQLIMGMGMPLSGTMDDIEMNYVVGNIHTDLLFSDKGVYNTRVERIGPEVLKR